VTLLIVLAYFPPQAVHQEGAFTAASRAASAFRSARRALLAMGAREARRLVNEFGVKGFKFHPTIGSDWPMITPERWLADFEKIDIKPENRPLILEENAVRLLGL
jgi:predicted TIM-barrel fold metal-dependent hydrolase